MSRFRGDLSAGVRFLLVREREIATLPADARRRMMARARAALGAQPYAAPPTRDAPRLRRWALAAVLLCLASAAAGAAGYEFRLRAASSLLPAPPKAPPSFRVHRKGNEW